MKYVTVKMLERLEACEEQVELFRMTFGTRVLINDKNLRKAVDADLSVEWLVGELFNDAKTEIELARIHHATRKKALKALKRIKRTGEGEYEKNEPLINAFTWDETEEGYDFWENIYHTSIDTKRIVGVLLKR